VQHIHYSDGEISLCRLGAPQVAKADDETTTELHALIRRACPHAQPGAPIPLTLTYEEQGQGLPGPNDPAAPNSRESYTISIRKDGITLHGRTAAGLFYAVQTLRQLVVGDRLPVVEIEDWPSLAYRGFMLDTSHGAVPTVAEVERQLDELARWKANQFFFYVETNLDLTGYPLLHQESNWTAENIRTIVAYARRRHIDVVPCVELYGHLHDLFRIERYSGLAALPQGGEANPANKDAQALLEGWLRQYAALFPSAWIHLGFDEPFELERAGTAAAEGVAPDTLWLQHLQRMAHIATELGKRPLFWADIDEGAYIFNKYPGLAAGLPKNAVAVPWFYDARPNYDTLLDLFAANHVPIVVASGISDWDNIAPDFDSTFINIDGFLAAGRKANALGLLNTEWSDSAMALHREAAPAMAYGAVAAWQFQPVDREQFFSEYAHIRYPAPVAEQIAIALSSIARAQTLLREALGPETSFRLFDDAFQAQTAARAAANLSQLRQTRLAAEAAEEAILQSPGPDDDGLLVAAQMLDYAAMKFLYASEIAANFDQLPQHPTKADVDYLLKREMSARNHSRVGDLIDISGELEARYREQWLRQYKPYRLDTALARWRIEQQYWIQFQQSVWTVVRGFKEGDARPTLGQVLAMR
jgi:hypothetical protein